MAYCRYYRDNSVSITTLSSGAHDTTLERTDLAFSLGVTDTSGARPHPRPHRSRQLAQCNGHSGVQGHPWRRRSRQLARRNVRVAEAPWATRARSLARARTTPPSTAPISPARSLQRTPPVREATLGGTDLADSPAVNGASTEPATDLAGLAISLRMSGMSEKSPSHTVICLFNQ